MKKFLIFTSAVCLIVASICTFSVSAEKINVEIDGKTVDFDVAPEIINGRTMVPMRKIFEELGALVKWNDDTQTASARKSSKTVSVTVNSSTLSIDKGNVDESGNPVVENVSLDVPTQIISNRTLVSARAVSEAFGLDVNWNESTNTVEITSEKSSDDSWKENRVKINLEDLKSGSGVEVNGDRLLITRGGDYTLSGTFSGNVCVNSDEKVKIRLSDANITSNENPCIFFENTDKAYITVSADTKNTLTAKNCEKGAIYSKDNLEIEGEGTLFIKSDSGHGIKASDNLTIENSAIEITAEGDAINVNDTLEISGGSITAVCKGDGIASESIVKITGGEIDITTTAEPVISSNEGDFHRPGEESVSADFEKSSKGIKADWFLLITGGKINVNSADHAIHCADEIQIDGGDITLNSEYGKGITAHANLTINGENTVIDVLKSTEGLESKNILTVNNGKINIVSSDDGINATGGNSGEMFGGPGGGRGFGNMPTPPEGNENMPEPPNFENPPQMPEKGDRPNREERGDRGDLGGGKRADLKDCLVINGGDIEVYAQDDCFDSNGNLLINGGTVKGVKTNGTFCGNFGVFDPDGTLTIGENATVVAACMQGNERNIETPTGSVTAEFENAHDAGDKITVKNSSGKTIAEFTPKGKYRAVFACSPNLLSGETCYVSAGSETVSAVCR